MNCMPVTNPSSRMGMSGIQKITGYAKRFLPAIAILLCWASCVNGGDEKPPMPTFKVMVETVYAKVAVTDTLNRYVTGLEKDDFEIFEDNIRQTIVHFSQQSAPVSIGILFDVSESMGFRRNIDISRRWFRQLVRSRNYNPEDEYFLITFNRTIKLVLDFDDDRTGSPDSITTLKAGGWTALYDAVYMGINKVKEGKNEKKALILFTDGEDNSSRYHWSEIRDLCKESDVQVYAIGVLGPGNYGNVLKDFAKYSGGRVFFPDQQVNVDSFMNIIHTELRNQYLLGYVPINKNRDGKWRKINVKLNAPPGFPKMSVRTKSGYYAPKN
jgi:Ca-activated chloride channel homolog